MKISSKKILFITLIYSALTYSLQANALTCTGKILFFAVSDFINNNTDSRPWYKPSFAQKAQHHYLCQAGEQDSAVCKQKVATIMLAIALNKTVEFIYETNKSCSDNISAVVPQFITILAD